MKSFKCPECGATEIRSHLCVSTDWSTGGKATNPWSYVYFNSFVVRNAIAISPLILEKGGMILLTKKLKRNGC